MNKVIYFSRNKKAGFSIQKVFKTIISHSNNASNLSFEVPCYRVNIPSVLKNLKFVYSNKDNKKVHHITGDIHYCILALITCKTVLTVHDMVLLKKTKNIFKKIFYYIFWYYLPIKLATKVTCISEETKKDIQKYVKRDDIIVIKNPVSDDFKRTFKKFNEKMPVILHIGTGWNKNLTNVIKSLESIDCNLRIIGKLSESDKELLKKLKVNFTNVFGISDKEIIEEYKSADIISFPSIFEGFGMPIIEGQATGRVVLTSNLSPMKDVGNTSVHLVEPNSIESIKNGFLKLINNKVYRESLIYKGLENVNKYKSINIVDQYNIVYCDLK